MQYLLGIDIGTSGVKTLIIDVEGRPVASAMAEHPLYTPKPLWAEQNPEDWWQSTVLTVREVLTKSGISAGDIRGIGLSGQMHGSVFLDADGQVIRPALLWCDQRTQAECDWITETIGVDKVVEYTLNPVLTGFTAGKIVWLRNHEPQNYARIAKVLLPKDYIRYRLTSQFAGEVSDASGTSLFNVRKRQWSDEMLEGTGIPKEWMVPVYESVEATSRVSEAGSTETGLKVGTPVVGGGGDQAAGAVGNGIVQTGVVSVSMGTSGVVFAFADEPVMDPGLRTHTFCHAVPGKWHVMGVMLSAGGSLRWYRDELCQQEMATARLLDKDPYELITAEAALAPAGCEGTVFLPYLSGERTPHKDANARGVFFGLTLRSNKQQMARSVLEGVCYGLKDSFEIMKEMGVVINQSRVSGGGARSTVWRQILADVTGIGQSVINIDEGPALGVALLAGVGTGVWQSVEQACQATISVVSTTHSQQNNRNTYDGTYEVYKKLYHSLKADFASVAKIP